MFFKYFLINFIAVNLQLINHDHENYESLLPNDDDEDDFADQISKHHFYKMKNSSEPVPKKSKLLQNILNSPDVTSALDRINISDRQAVILVGAIGKANNADLENSILSRSTVHRRRLIHRQKIRDEVMTEFEEKPKTALVVHWDGKLMINSTSKENSKDHCDRIAVVVSGLQTEKILGIPKALSGTGKAQATATYNLLVSAKKVDDVVAMSFDTTASNSGKIKGACKLLEQLIGRNLLYFACRHHVYEIIAQAAFVSVVGQTTSPYVSLFQKFQN
jgi:hypothetical protein